MRSIYLGSTERALSLLEGNGEIVRATQASTSIEPWPPLDQKEAGAWPQLFHCLCGKQKKASVIELWLWFLLFLTQSQTQQRTKNAMYEAHSTALQGAGAEFLVALVATCNWVTTK